MNPEEMLFSLVPITWTQLWPEVLGNGVWAAVGALGFVLFRWIAIRRPNKKIWGLSQPVKLLICVATSAQMNKQELRAKATGLGQLHAFAILSHSLSLAYRKIETKKVVFSEDRVAMDIGCDLVLLGGPENNRITRKFLEQINSEPIANQEDNVIEWFSSHNKEQFCTEIKDKAVIKDYGLIIRMVNPFSHQKRRIFLFSGAHTFGTIAAARYFVESPSIRKLKSSASFAAIVSCQLLDEYPVSIKLERFSEFHDS